jgi:hypothetical protein
MFLDEFSGAEAPINLRTIVKVTSRPAGKLYRFQFVTALLPRRLAAVADRRYSAKANWKRYKAIRNN